MSSIQYGTPFSCKETIEKIIALQSKLSPNEELLPIPQYLKDVTNGYKELIGSITSFEHLETIRDKIIMFEKKIPTILHTTDPKIRAKIDNIDSDYEPSCDSEEEADDPEEEAHSSDESDSDDSEEEVEEVSEEINSIDNTNVVKEEINNVYIPNMILLKNIGTKVEPPEYAEDIFDISPEHFYRTIEKFDPKKLRYIIDNKEKFSSYLKDDKNYFSRLSDYLARSNDGEIEALYTNKGRSYVCSRMSLQSMKREFRAAICSEYYDDLDIENCHPVLLQMLYRQHNITCPALDNYIAKRDTILNFGNRREIKTLFIGALNGAKYELREGEELSELLFQFAEEIDRNNNILLTIPSIQEKYKKWENVKRSEKRNIRRRHISNPKYSFMSFMLCHEEDRILNSIWLLFGRPDDCVFCFDGLMVKKDSISDEMINKVNAAIRNDKKSAAFVIRKKEFSSRIKFPNSVEETPEIDWNKTSIGERDLIPEYTDEETVTKFFGANILVSTNTGIIYVKRVEKDGVEKWHEVQKQWLMSQLDKERFIVNKEYDPTNKKSKEYIATTLSGYLEMCLKKEKEKRIPHYRNIFYRPYVDNKIKTDEDGKYYNTFTGFPLEKDDQEIDLNFEDTPMYNFIRDEVCNGDKAEFNHINAHIADMIQDGGTIKTNSHYFISDSGCGKGLLSAWIGKVMSDEHVINIGNMNKHFKERFTSESSQKILKVFEDIGKDETHKNRDLIKGTITATKERTEVKYGHAKYENNYARMWFYSNHTTALSMNHDERRFTVHVMKGYKVPKELKASNPKLTYKDWKIEHFRGLYADLADHKKILAAFRFYKNYKYDKKLAYEPHENDQLQLLKDNTIDSPIAFLQSKYPEWFLNKNDDLVIRKSEMERHYNDWCKCNDRQFNKSYATAKLEWATRFSEHFKDYELYKREGYGMCERKLHGGVRHYIIDKEKLKKGFQEYFNNPSYDIENC